MKIGMIGLGIMGKPMAKNLLKAGYDLTVSKSNRASGELVEAGAKAASNQEIGETCDVVLTMVPNSPQVKAVMLGEDGVAAHMKPGSVFIDMSSINPVASKEIAAELEKFRLGGELEKVIRHFFPDLFELLKQVSDPRHQSYITYGNHVLMMTRILSAIFYINTMRKQVRNSTVKLRLPISDISVGSG